MTSQLVSLLLLPLTQSYIPHKVSLSLKNQDIFHMEVMSSQNLAPPKYTFSYKSFFSQQKPLK